MDKQQSWEWVTQHRLPLFLRSDLYSEYKLCKLLMVYTLEHNVTSIVNTDTLRPQKSQSATRLPSRKIVHAELQSKGSSSAVCLPSLSPRGDCEESPPLGSTLSSSTALSHISVSKSDIELGSKGQQQQRSSGSLVSLSQQKLLQKQVNLSPDVPCIVLDDGSPEKTGGKGSRSVVKDTVKMTAEDFEFIGTKSGMSALWKFLRGTMGERNWLFWLDAERIKYHIKPIDQQRYIMLAQLHVQRVIMRYFNISISLDYFVKCMTGTYIQVVH